MKKNTFKVKVITLPRRQDRRDKLEKQQFFKDIDFEYAIGINGQEYELTDFDKEFIQEQIKESLLNKILFMKDEMNEHTLHVQLEDIAKKTFSKNFSLKPEFLIHLSII